MRFFREGLRWACGIVVVVFFQSRDGDPPMWGPHPHVSPTWFSRLSRWFSSFWLRAYRVRYRPLPRCTVARASGSHSPRASQPSRPGNTHRGHSRCALASPWWVGAQFS